MRPRRVRANNMIVRAQVAIRGPKPAVWAAITDLDHASTTIRGIEALEIVERPAKGLVGLRWRETRLYFGKPTTVEKRVIAATDGESFTTSSEFEGDVFLSTLSISEGADGACTLTSAHESKPGSAGKRFMWATMGFLFKGALRKALLEDLDDIKAAVEKGPRVAPADARPA